MKAIREIVFYKNYFDTFCEKLNDKIIEKIDEVLFMITIIERIPSKFFRNINGEKGLYEIRVEYESGRFNYHSYIFTGAINNKCN